MPISRLRPSRTDAVSHFGPVRMRVAAVAGIASAPTTGADAARPRAHLLQPDCRAALLGTAALGRASRRMLQGPPRPSPLHSLSRTPLLAHTHTGAVVGVGLSMDACAFVCFCVDRRASRCDGQLGLPAVAGTCASQHRLIAYDSEDACMLACTHAIGWQSRLCRRLGRRRSQRPSSAVPPVRPAAYVRCSNLCARARFRVDSKLFVFARCAMVLTRACVRLCVCVRACMRACVQLRTSVCACVCVGPPVARRGPAVFIDRRAGGRVCALRVSRRSGRRRNLDEPHDRRTMGCEIWAHVGGRRRRGHLRHRRLRRHLLQRRLGEHRRRCAGRTRSGGRGYWGYSACLRGTMVYQGVCGVLKG